MFDPNFGYASRDALEEAFAAHVSPGKVATFRGYGISIAMGRREGARFWDAYDGRAYINCHANGGVFNLGHRHPRIVAALREALEGLDIGNHHLVSAARARLADRLSATTRHELPGVIVGVGGGEAVDVAVKAVRAATRRPVIVSAVGAYHGHTGLALALGDPSFRTPFGPSSADYVQVPFDDLPALDAAVGERTAAVFLETIPATLGMPIARPGYFAGVERLCRERGAKLVLDEVQAGLGRCGAVWAYQLDGLAPDAIVTGKGLSGGMYPIAATLLSRELFAFFADNPFIHISTFGGAELGCAAALAVLDIIEEPGFLPRVEELGTRLERELAGLPFQLRRRGMMMGLKFPMAYGGQFAAKALIDQGVFAVFANHDTSVCQFLPALTLTDDETGELIQLVRKAFT